MFRLLQVLLVVGAARAAQVTSEVCSQADHCAEENNWGAGWLQDKYVLESRLVTDVTASVAASEAGPLTENLHAKDFSDVNIPITNSVIYVTIWVLLLVVAHELYVSGGAKPLLANHEQSNNLILQCTFLYAWFLPFVAASLVVPLSLDYSLAMGQSATASGVFLSAGAIWSVAGLLAGKTLTNEQNWDQRWARKIYIWCAFFSVIGYFIIAFLLQAAVAWGPEGRQRAFWFVLLLMGVITFLASLPGIAWNTMWNVVTPQEEKTFWMILTQCSRNAGFILGPVAFAGLSYAVRGGREASPISMMGWSMIGIQFFSLASLSAASLVFPTEIKKVEPKSEASPETAREEEQTSEMKPEQLSPESREKIVWNMVNYSYERPFSVAAIEVATIMLLEVTYNWSPELCGTAFLVVAAASLTFTAISSLLLSRKFLSESSVFFGSSLCGLCGVILLFDWKSFGAASLLCADAIVYGGASVANGIAEGWGSRAATPGTSYSVEAYRVRNIAGVNVSRFLAPIVARFLLDFGGRNFYAALQLVMCLLGTATVYRTVSLVWQGTADRAKNAEDTMEATKGFSNDALSENGNKTR